MPQTRNLPVFQSIFVSSTATRIRAVVVRTAQSVYLGCVITYLRREIRGLSDALGPAEEAVVCWLLHYLAVEHHDGVAKHQ
jgi:hypothetical protein